MWYCLFIALMYFMSVLVIVLLLFQSQLNNSYFNLASHFFISHLHLLINNIIIPFKNTDKRIISKKPES